MATVPKNVSVKLGQEVFVLSSTGEVVRTMVAKLYKDWYAFFNGGSSSGDHWFDYESAVEAADRHISVRQVALRKELRALGKRRNALQTPEYRESVRSAPYRVVGSRMDMFSDTHTPRTRTLKSVVCPGEYLMYDSIVYVTITPSTCPWEDVYRPCDHFVLETKIATVSLLPSGVVHYTYQTRYEVRAHHLTVLAAAEALRAESRLGEHAKVRLVSFAEEKDWQDKHDDIPF